MKIYTCSPFAFEFDLLNLKIAEEADVVDGIFIIEANQTLRGNAKPFNLKLRKNEYQQHPKLHLCFLKDQLTRNLKTLHDYNNAKTKDSVLKFMDYADDDVLICSDVDEINKKEDIGFIVDQAKKYGFVTMRQTLYYFKINLKKGREGGWSHAFAITGKKMREMGNKIYQLRKHTGKEIATNGKHFSYVATPEMISYKIKNNGHPEFTKDTFTDIQQIKARINNQIDPFDRKQKSGEVMKLTKVAIDETYPNTILNNLPYWERYIAR